MIVDCAVYRDGARVDRPATIAGATDDDPGCFTWIGMHDPTPEEIDEVGEECALHELLVEDVRNAHQRAKWDAFEETVLVVLKTALYRPPDQVEIGELQVILGRGYVVTVRHGDAAALGEVRRRLEADPDLLRLGPLAVLYGIADHVVDAYSPVLSELETDVDEAEQAVFSPERTNEAPRVYRLKRQVLELRRNIVPVGAVVDSLCQPEPHGVPPQLVDYFTDVADHAHRVMGRVEVARELLTDALNANLAQQGVQQNEDMRRISAWAAVFAAPTLLAGVWGMNFERMPELDNALGYPLAVLAMVALSGTLIAIFRRAGWL
ncbi:magnesium and cobalt transport protein CorA [Iamia majanohamensis]|uniref:Magnesium and cobalt transport protein CorA n=1 Tax=Iamia majanohamensis TaxID=467976 RepID=A0AAF0BX17_9ACTN|nr:magnesium and cobalt transport protein CorA [Iamia majanohamensis]WCO68633.1 magnesium and cobalt transport protein CorA [Iamia majanohamensis]